MSNTPKLRTNNTPPVQGLQLGFQCNVQLGPDGMPWMGITFAMGTSSYTLGVPVASVDEFLSMVNQTMLDELEKYNAAKYQADQVAQPKLVLPNDVGQLLVPRAR